MKASSPSTCVGLSGAHSRAVRGSSSLESISRRQSRSAQSLGSVASDRVPVGGDRAAGAADRLAPGGGGRLDQVAFLPELAPDAGVVEHSEEASGGVGAGRAALPAHREGELVPDASGAHRAEQPRGFARVGGLLRDGGGA